MQYLHLKITPNETLKAVLTEIPTIQIQPLLLGPNQCVTRTERFHKGAAYLTRPPTPKELITGDPEIDFENIGRVLRGATKGYVKPASKELEPNFCEYINKYGTAGELEEKKEIPYAAPPDNNTFSLQVINKMEVKEALQKYAFHNQYLVTHADSSQFALFHSLAKKLNDSKEVLVLAAYADWELPPMLSSYNGLQAILLHGEIDNDSYLLRILTSEQTLQYPTPQIPPV